MGHEVIESVEATPSSVLPQRDNSFDVGQWFWVKTEEKDYDDDGNRSEKIAEYLGCVTHIGTNYAELRGSGYEWKILFSDFHNECREEPNARSVIESKVEEYRQQVHLKMDEIRELTARLGVSKRPVITGESESDESSRALKVLNDGEGKDNVDKYKTDLITAKEKTLPQLFKEIESANESMAQWMKAEMIPMIAQSKALKSSIEVVEDRVFSVELYAGLLEEVAQIKQGKPAPIGTQLHLMQNMCFMDEECIAGYRIGGIDCRSIKDFDRWLKRKENFSRLLPFDRCMVAFRVRRYAKEYEWDGRIKSLFMNFHYRDMDKLTFLYIRNGAQLFRLSTEINFGSSLFPDEDEFDFNQKMWAKIDYQGNVESFFTNDQYEQIVADMKERRERKARESEQWIKDHPEENEIFNPHRDSDWFSDRKSYEPFDQTSVHFDAMTKKIADQIRSYNRISLIIQGIFDRSTILHPHPPVRLWSPESFAASVKLVYDANMVLHFNEPPDFEAYRSKCNASLKTGSVTIGQQDFWESLEAEKECDRLDRTHRYGRSDYRPKRFKPYGNPGPGYLAYVSNWKVRSGIAKYEWMRDRQRRSWGSSKEVSASISVPSNKIFNVDAYTPGDFKMFYEDPRTRRNYLKWADLLIGAEEYHAGNLKVENGKA